MLIWLFHGPSGYSLLTGLLCDSTGHSERKKKKRQTEEEWEDNIKEWTGTDFAS